MSRKILPVLLLAVAWSAIPALAQDEGQKRGHGKHHDPEARMEHLIEKLELTDEQAAAARPIFEDAHAEHRAAMERHREAMRSDFEAIAARTESRLAEVLTPEQLAEFREMRSKMKERMAERGHRPRGGDHDHE